MATPAGSGGGGGGNRQVTGLEILVGTAPGGGFDQTARTAAKVMEDAKLARNVQVQNLPGAGNTIALQRLVNEKGNGKVMQQMGLGLVGGVYTNKSKATLDQTTPVARLTEEPEIVVVNKDSPYQSFDQLPGGLEGRPGQGLGRRRVRSRRPRPPGPDADRQEAGIDPKQVNFVSYDGGGELLAAVLGGQVAFGVTGVGETKDQIDAGEIRALAVTSAEPVESLDATPTLKEQGVDLEFTNWRGWVAAPEAQRGRQADPDRPGHQDARLPGVEGRPGPERLDRRLHGRRRVRRLPQGREPARRRRARPSWGWHELLAERLRGRSELGVSVLLAALGVLVLVDASRIPTDFTQRGPVGPAAVPVVVGVALLVIAVLLARDVLRGGHGESEMGEDVDLSHPSDWRTVLLLIAAFLANVVLIDRVGFPISGAVLFWGAAYALGSRHWLRDPLIALALSVVTYLIFSRGLGIGLPGGPLEGVM